MRFLLVIISFCVLFFSSCKVQPVTISKVGAVKVKEYSIKGATVEVEVTVNNPNAMGFKIYRSDLNLKLNNLDLGKAEISKNVKVKRRSETTATIELEADFAKLGPAVLLTAGQLFGKGGAKPTVNLKGEIKAGNLFVKKRFPIDINQKVNLSK